MIVLKYQVQGLNLEIEFVVTQETDELILGYDWLAAQDCHWHFKDRVVYVRGHPVELRTRQAGANVRCISGGIKMVTTRRETARQDSSLGEKMAPEAEPGCTTPAQPAKNEQAVVKEPGSIKDQPETTLRTRRRRRRRMRGRRHVSSRTSTNIGDLVPYREWTPEYLAAMQQADIDLAEVRKWKLGVNEKPSWSDI
jgi:hypothetical protein